ncbi:MAG: class I SAM-dependent methyltransferase [Alphaproteobacteria bacterium]|nr:class I SAM-dependent methyltransferase [Alphaproteobacteria bacterium]
MGARLAFARAQMRRALSPKGIAKILTNPGKVMHFLGTELWDVKYRQTPLAVQIAVLRRSIAAMAEVSQIDRPPVAPVIVEDFVGGSSAGSSDTEELRALFQKYGSDKSTGHNYYLLYSWLLSAKRREDLSMLEIGLGTNNIDVPSNMGLDGKPGASLRAFRDWAPRIRVFGADVDKRVLFAEERIETFYVDQTQPLVLAELAARFAPASFDMIIDDGLHNSEANLNTLLFALPLLKYNGALVIEDIGLADLPYWQVVFGLLTPKYRGTFLDARGGYVALILPSSRG